MPSNFAYYLNFKVIFPGNIKLDPIVVTQEEC